VVNHLASAAHGEHAAGVAPFPPDPALPQVLRELRTKTGRSQEDVAHEVGLTLGSYARIERGLADPKWSTLRRIADALGVSLGDLGRAIEERAGGDGS
jgi:transcriptional regulator with XRE-family HTH domain